MFRVLIPCRTYIYIFIHYRVLSQVKRTIIVYNIHYYHIQGDQNFTLQKNGTLRYYVIYYIFYNTKFWSLSVICIRILCRYKTLYFIDLYRYPIIFYNIHLIWNGSIYNTQYTRCSHRNIQDSRHVSWRVGVVKLDNNNNNIIMLYRNTISYYILNVKC